MYSVYVNKEVCTLNTHTCVDELPAYSEHDLAIACCVGHQLQDLLVGFSFYRNAVYTHELIPCPQTPVLLCCTQRHDSTDVHLHTRGERARERERETREI